MRQRLGCSVYARPGDGALIATLDCHGLIPLDCFKDRIDPRVITDPSPLLPILVKAAAMQVKLTGLEFENALIQGNFEVAL